MTPLGLVNPKCIALIGSGVVMHVPSFFAELDALKAKQSGMAARWVVLASTSMGT